MTERVADVVIGACPTGELGKVWPTVRDWLEAALAYAAQHEMHVDEVRDRLATGELLLLLMYVGQELKAAAVLEHGFRAFDHRPYLALIACGGSMLPTWIDPLVDTCKRIGRDLDCAQVIVLGRPGWEPILRRRGLKKRLCLMTWDIQG